MTQVIKDYWEHRASHQQLSPASTTNDVYLRQLEVKTFIEILKTLPLGDQSSILDAGCGDGYSTIRIAQAFPTFEFLGLDFSKNMVHNAIANLEAHSELQDRVSFKAGDVTCLNDRQLYQAFDVVITDRCLINLDSSQAQAAAVAQIAGCIKRNGYYVAIENFHEGQRNLTNARAVLGLPAIPIRWHNLYFSLGQFKAMAAPFFEEITFYDFSSSYYFATRVVYSALCKMQGLEPDYNHQIHRLAIDLPWGGQFSPICMVTMKKK